MDSVAATAREALQELASVSGLQVKWYDFVCFAIIVGGIICAVVLIYKSEGCGWRQLSKSKYQSLLLSGLSDDEAEIGATSMAGYVGWDQLWMTCWKGLHPAWLFGTRLVSFLVLAGILLWDYSKYEALDLLYYTEWTFLMVIVYFAIATVVSYHGCRRYSKEEGDSFSISYSIDYRLPTRRDAKLTDAAKYETTCRRKAIKKKAGFWGYAMQVLYQTSAGAAAITDIVFWTVIVPGLSMTNLQLNWVMGIVHTLNIAVLLLDSMLNNMPFPWFRIAYFLLWSSIYVIFQWVVHALGITWWPYPFILLSNPWAPLWYLCLAFLHIPCYSIYCLIVKAKVSVFSKLFPDTFVGKHC